MSYCQAALGHPWHGPYHDTEYGFPIDDDDRLFERLILEINQAGLSWLTILKKKEGFVAAGYRYSPGPNDVPVSKYLIFIPRKQFEEVTGGKNPQTSLENLPTMFDIDPTLIPNRMGDAAGSLFADEVW